MGFSASLTQCHEPPKYFQIQQVTLVKLGL